MTEKEVAQARGAAIRKELGQLERGAQLGRRSYATEAHLRIEALFARLDAR